jgi:hypothetical protein
MTLGIFTVFFCAVTGKGGHLMLGYQKSVTTLAGHGADR